TKIITKDLPIVLFGKEYWSKLINFETLIEFGTIDREDLNLFFITSSVEDAFSHIASRLNPNHSQ
ncbi:MAG: LOG family protein, partial [Gammaproteobacteria bacterium]